MTHERYNLGLTHEEKTLKICLLTGVLRTGEVGDLVVLLLFVIMLPLGESFK